MKNFFVFNGNTSNGIGILQNDECSEPMFNKNCQEKWLNEQKYYDINYNNGTSLSIRFISFLSFFFPVDFSLWEWRGWSPVSTLFECVSQRSIAPGKHPPDRARGKETERESKRTIEIDIERDRVRVGVSDRSGG